MNRYFKPILCVIIVLITLYYASFSIMPKITIINQSGETLERAEVKLPNSRLDFAPIAIDGNNALYYDIKQEDGTYKYRFKAAGFKHKGSCGYVTSNEITKRVVITVSKEKVHCDETQ
ncbi:hypothetical protein [Thalassotalea sp. Y01]|uniref:hypothetical protein n=1 Tax=Thalassotalea sp. Y01 TaxID=2729613 RepID=UPI00145C5509|nr:hypothetical protein [Thalassotalea sp. Y01]NMP17612.1 hypothetical protein [Thalassotalea sp. Y01]